MLLTPLGLLSVDPLKRMTIEEVLVHPWITKKNTELREARVAELNDGKKGFSLLFATTSGH